MSFLRYFVVKRTFTGEICSLQDGVPRTEKRDTIACLELTEAGQHVKFSALIEAWKAGTLEGNALLVKPVEGRSS